MNHGMKLYLRIWRQPDAKTPGKFVEYVWTTSRPYVVLEMLDVLNEDLIKKGELPSNSTATARGICGTCGMVINGSAHGTSMRAPSANCTCGISRMATDHHRAVAGSGLSVIKDLVVDRSALDRIIVAGGYVSSTRRAPDANAIPVSKEQYEEAMDSAACIGCGACVAACPNGSAALFTAAKISHLVTLPQGQVERRERALIWSSRWISRASATARTTANARRSARRTSLSKSSPACA